MAARNDLTVGSVWKQLIIYALPVVAGSLLQSVYGLADMYIASIFIGSSGISAINNGSQIMTLFTQIVIGLTNGGNIMVGQYFGAGDEKNRDELTGSFFLLMLGIGAAALVVLFSLSGALMSFMKAPALAEATAYLRITALGALSITGYNSICAVLRAVGNSRKPFHFVIAATLTNIVLDLIFVGVLGWGVAGAAAATAISQTLSFLLALGYLMRRKSIFSFSSSALRLRLAHVRAVLSLGVPCALQMTVASVSWLTVTFLINDYGVLISAANGISNKIKDLCQTFISSMTVAASSMIAQTLGSGKFDRAKTVLYRAMTLACGMAVIIITAVQLLAPTLIGIFTHEPEVLAAGVKNLRIEIFSQVFYAVFLVYHSLMTGAGHTKMVLLSSFTNCILFRMVLALLFNHLWGLTGIYFACMIAPASSIPVGWLYTRSGRWKRSLVK